MSFKKFTSLLVLLVYVTGTTGYAQEKEDDSGDFVELNSGEVAPFDGYLFHSDSLADLVAKQDREKEELRLFAETEQKKLKLELETEVKKKEVEIQITTTKYEDLLKLNKAEIDRLSREAKYNSWLTSGSFIAGVVVGGLVIASTIKLTLTIAK
jgi:hypothetical protein